uniref:Leucine rich repeat containing 72 n=1 Tax=Cyprinodon variegatus TaxID=28743 RepID=A0A3Q2CL09_CYPVA
MKTETEGSSITSLELFFSGFPRIVGLSYFPNLCQLTIDISLLQKCDQLKKLYLYDNQIREIKNLELQGNLPVLWLNNNCITKIQGLNTMNNLSELNLSDNAIEKIGHNLDPNVNLEILNLSGNKICSFKEGFYSFFMFSFPEKLGTEVTIYLSSSSLESVVLKKQRYYNMRVHAVQRNLTETQAALTERKMSLTQLPGERISVTRKVSELFVWWRASPQTPGTGLEITNRTFKSRQHRYNKSLFVFQTYRYTSCCNLLLPSFSASDNKIFRIHNSALRLRFEDKLHSHLVSEESTTLIFAIWNYRRRLEYLFYVADPDKCEKEQTLCVLEEGFKTRQQLEVSELLEAAECISKLFPPPVGHVIVCKVHVGNSMPIHDKKPEELSRHPKVYSVYQYIDVGTEPSSGPEGSIPCQKHWFLFDHELILPEENHLYTLSHPLVDNQGLVVFLWDPECRLWGSNRVLSAFSEHKRTALTPRPSLPINYWVINTYIMYALLAHSRTDSERPRSLSLLSTAQLLSHLGPAPWDPCRELEPDWTEKITALNLDNQRLSELCNLDKLVNLRWASFNHNNISVSENGDEHDITELEKLDALPSLTELSVAGNPASITGGLVCPLNPIRHFEQLEIFFPTVIGFH